MLTYAGSIIQGHELDEIEKSEAQRRRRLCNLR
jgi:hypothetical protein